MAHQPETEDEPALLAARVELALPKALKDMGKYGPLGDDAGVDD